MSFSDGFKDGFGLVNAAYENNAKKADRAGAESSRLEEAKLTAKYRSDVLKEQATGNRNTEAHQVTQEKNRAAQLERDSTNKSDEIAYRQGVFDSNQTDIKIVRDQQIATNAQVIKDRAAKDELQDKQNKSRNAAMAATRLIQQSQNAVTEEDFKQVFEDLLETQGTLVEANIAMNPVVGLEQEVMIDQINKLAVGEEVNDEAVVNVLQQVLGTSAKFQEGALITPETHPSAPKAFYGQGFKVVGIQARSVKLQDDSERGGRGPYLKPTVAVTVEDGQGRRSMYLTHMTEKRQGTGAPVRIYPEDIIKGAAAQINYRRAYSPEALSKLREAIKRNAYSDESGYYDVRAYDKARRELSKNLLENLDARQVMDMPVTAGASITWAEFSQGDQWEDYVESKLLMPDSRALPERDEVDLMLSQLRDHPEIKKINSSREKLGRAPLDEIELSQASVFFKSNESGEIQLDKGNDQRDWFRKMSVLKSANRISNPEEFRRTGRGGYVQKSQTGYLGAHRNVQQGGVMTEVSIEEDGVSFPLMVPTLTKAEINTLKNMNIEGNADNIPKSIKDKARQHMRERMNLGLDPFYQFGERKK
jgi:hypothetical protein